MSPARGGGRPRGGRGRSARLSGAERYPRVARVNEVLREIIADTLARLADVDERLELVGITGVEVEADLRRAVVYFSSRDEHADDVLESHRVRFQTAIAQQARLRRTPQLSFREDPAVTQGWNVEAALQRLRDEPEEAEEPEEEDDRDGGDDE